MSSVLDRGEGEAPQLALVIGANGGIGHALRVRLLDRYPSLLLVSVSREQALPINDRDTPLAADICAEDEVNALPEQLKDYGPFDLCLIATGWLHDEAMQPEKSFKQLNVEQMQRSFMINTIAPVLAIKALMPVLSKQARIGVLSARVGSVSDNRLGGWHSYRASKSALNMLIKNFAIELSRAPKKKIIVGLQPGTTATPLSAPFQKNVAEGHLQTPQYTATQLVEVMARLLPEDSGKLFDFLGEEFAP